MKTSAAIKKGFKLYFAGFGDALAYAVVVTLIALLPLVPMLALLEKSLTWFSLLCVPLFILVTLVVRQNAAGVLQSRCRGESRLASPELVSTAGYGKKLWQGIKLMILLLLWALPGIAVSAVAVGLYKGDLNAASIAINYLGIPLIPDNLSVSIAMWINQLGGGDIIKGGIKMFGLYGACWLPLVIGCMLHSGARHAFACGNRSLFKGHRGGLIAVWIISLITLIPFAAGAAVILYLQLPPVIKAVKNFAFDGLSTQLKSIGLWLAGAAAVLLVPMIPLRHLMIAAYADGCRKQ